MGNHAPFCLDVTGKRCEKANSSRLDMFPDAAATLRKRLMLFFNHSLFFRGWDTSSLESHEHRCRYCRMLLHALSVRSCAHLSFPWADYHSFVGNNSQCIIYIFERFMIWHLLEQKYEHIIWPWKISGTYQEKS